MRSFPSAFNAVLCLSCSLLACSSAWAASPITSIARASTKANGGQVFGGSHHPVFSPDGNLVVFNSEATKLVSGDTNGCVDLFLKNLTTKAIQRVSTSATGAQAVSASYGAAFSPDGKKLAFYSYAANLVAGETGFYEDVYVKTLSSGALVRVSQSKAGVPGNGDSFNSVFTPDGKKVIFQSDASNLVSGDTNGVSDIFIKTLSTGAIKRISVTPGGGQTNGPSFTPQVSRDGSLVMFASQASNIYANDTSGTDIFLYALATGDMWLVSTNSAGVPAKDDCDMPQFSTDGTKVVFMSAATNLVSGVTAGRYQIFMSRP